jgi:hypothetical protein
LAAVRQDAEADAYPEPQCQGAGVGRLVDLAPDGQARNAPPVLRPERLVWLAWVALCIPAEVPSGGRSCAEMAAATAQWERLVWLSRKPKAVAARQPGPRKGEPSQPADSPDAPELGSPEALRPTPGVGPLVALEQKMSVSECGSER